MERANPRHFHKKKKPRVRHPISDHAIVRFLERNEIVDIKGFRRQLMTPLLKQAVNMSKRGDAVMHKENGLCFICKEGVVLTIITADHIRNKDGSIAPFNEGTNFII